MLGSSAALSDALAFVRARRQQIEESRSLPADVASALRGTGIFALGVPRALGGGEAAPMELMRTIEAIAAADGSAGWCAMVGIANNVSAGYMSEEGAREVFANPEAPMAGLAAPAGQAVREDGGLRVSGRWPFASGITHSDWVWAGCLVMENGAPRMTPAGPEIVHVCLPVKDVQVHDTWHVSGLCGTGSHDFSATNQFVPDRRAFILLDPATHRREPLYQMPALHLFVFQLACVSLGIARAALDEVTELAQSKVPTLYTVPLADKAAAHIEIARAEAALGAARAFLYDIAEEMWQTASDGRVPTNRQLALGRLACSQAVETGAAVARTASTIGGGSALFLSAPLQRHTRDAEAITHHFTVAPHVWEESGRMLLGRTPLAPVF